MSSVTVTYPEDLPESTRYWKQISGDWEDWTSNPSVAIAGNAIVLTLTDGAHGGTNVLAMSLTLRRRRQ